MRSPSRLFLFALCTLALCAPALAFAQWQPNQSIVPACGTFGMCRSCDLITLVQNLLNFFVYISVFVATLLLAYAGFLLLFAGPNPGNLEKAKSIFRRTLIGFFVVLLAWILVDTVMKVFYQEESRFGPWNEVLCAPEPNVAHLYQIPNNMPGATTTPGVPTGPGVTGGGVQCHPENTACSVSALKAAGYTDAQANVMSCIAMTESSGIPTRVNPSGGACGTFQILPSNWRNPRIHGPGCSPSTSCTNAACNAMAAYNLSRGRMSRGQSAYADWTCPGCNAKAAGCVARYDPAGR